MTRCPSPANPASIFLLNLEHNLIRSLDGLSSQLCNLVVLSLYDNQLDKMAGMQGLVSLKLLLLGRNRSVQSMSVVGKRDIIKKIHKPHEFECYVSRSQLEKRCCVDYYTLHLIRIYVFFFLFFFRLKLDKSRAAATPAQSRPS